jgi:hypothetical protein
MKTSKKTNKKEDKKTSKKTSVAFLSVTKIMIPFPLRNHKNYDVFRNGLLLVNNSDYTIKNNEIEFNCKFDCNSSDTITIKPNMTPTVVITI